MPGTGRFWEYEVTGVPRVPRHPLFKICLHDTTESDNKAHDRSLMPANKCQLTGASVRFPELSLGICRRTKGTFVRTQNSRPQYHSHPLKWIQSRSRKIQCRSPQGERGISSSRIKTRRFSHLSDFFQVKTPAYPEVNYQPTKGLTEFVSLIARFFYFWLAGILAYQSEPQHMVVTKENYQCNRCGDEGF